VWAEAKGVDCDDMTSFPATARHGRDKRTRRCPDEAHVLHFRADRARANVRLSGSRVRFLLHTGHFLSLLGISESSSDLSSASSLREPEGLDDPYMELSGWYSSGRLTTNAVKASSCLFGGKTRQAINRTSRRSWASVGT
jgi:hypothetical protein